MILVQNKDHPAMVKCAIDVGDSLNTASKVAIFKKLTYAEKKQVILEDITKKKNSWNFTKSVRNMSDTEGLDLLKSIIENSNAKRYIIAILKNFKFTRNVHALTQANAIVKNMNNIECLPITVEVIESLSVDTKIELLKKRISLVDSSDYYSRSRNISDSLAIIFFQDFKRQDIDKVYKSPVDCPYRKYLDKNNDKRRTREMC